MSNRRLTRSLRGRKYPYCKSATAVHFSVLFRCVVPTMRLKRTENCPRRATFSLRVFLPRRLLDIMFDLSNLKRVGYVEVGNPKHRAIIEEDRS